MRLITKRDTIRSVSGRWYNQYWTETDGWSSHNAQVSYKKLAALDPETCKESDIEKIIGPGWTALHCDECDTHVESVIEIERFEEHEVVRICPRCLNKAITLNQKFMGRHLNWRDSSENKRTKSGRSVSSFILDTGEMYISITNGHIFSPEGWVMHCRRIGLDTVSMKSTIEDVNGAKDEAIDIVMGQLEKLKDSIFKG